MPGPADLQVEMQCRNEQAMVDPAFRLTPELKMMHPHHPKMADKQTAAT